MPTDVDLLKTKDQFGKFLKKSMNSSLFTRTKGESMFDLKEKVLDGVLGDHAQLRETFASTLQKHVEQDG